MVERSPQQEEPAVKRRRGPLLGAGVALGVGLGAFLDGIVLHQILQWHNMLSSLIVPRDLVSAKVNMFWDGLFHAFAWLSTALGVALLWRVSHADAAERSGRVLVGGLAMGWGVFNTLEGAIDHQLFGIHHVRPGEHQLAWDLGFIAFGLLLVGVGWLLARTPAPRRLSSSPLPSPSPQAHAA
jgi:uncharacterized membrane protein